MNIAHQTLKTLAQICLWAMPTLQDELIVHSLQLPK
jgi:hypothetical protein